MSSDGQEWWAWRTTISGWGLGIAMVAQDGKYLEYLYAGDGAPVDPPTKDPRTWGELWRVPPDWESFADG